MLVMTPPARARLIIVLSQIIFILKEGGDDFSSRPYLIFSVERKLLPSVLSLLQWSLRYSIPFLRLFMTNLWAVICFSCFLMVVSISSFSFFVDLIKYKQGRFKHSLTDCARYSVTFDWYDTCVKHHHLQWNVHNGIRWPLLTISKD